MFLNSFKILPLLMDKLSIATCFSLLSVVSAAGAAGPPCNPTNVVTPIRTAYGYDGGQTRETADTDIRRAIKFEEHAAVCIEEQQDLSSPIISKGLIWVWYPKKGREYLIVRKEWRLLDANEYNTPMH